MNSLGYVRMVLWSFFGIRRRDAAGEELSKVRPLVLVAVAVALAALFGVTLWVLANVAVQSLGGESAGLPAASTQQAARQP